MESALALVKLMLVVLVKKPLVGIGVAGCISVLPGVMLVKSASSPAVPAGNALLLLSAGAMFGCCLLAVLLAVQVLRALVAGSTQRPAAKLAAAGILNCVGVTLVTSSLLHPYWQMMKPRATEASSQTRSAIVRHFTGEEDAASRLRKAAARPAGSKIPAMAELLLGRLKTLTQAMPTINGRKWFDEAAELWVAVADQLILVDDELKSRKIPGLAEDERKVLYVLPTMRNLHGHTAFERFSKVVDSASAVAKAPTNSVAFAAFQPAGTTHWKWYWPEVVTGYLSDRIARLQELEQALPRD